MSSVLPNGAGSISRIDRVETTAGIANTMTWTDMGDNGLSVFLDARLCAGMEVFVEPARFQDQLAWADVVVTGEGKLEETTKLGKAPQVIATLAWPVGVLVVGMFGQIDTTAKRLLGFFDSILEVPADFDPEGVQPLLQQETVCERFVDCGAEIGNRLLAKAVFL